MEDYILGKVILDGFPMKRLNHDSNPNLELFRGPLQEHPLGAILERWAAYTDLCVVIADASGRIVWVNAAFTRMCGYNSDELIGKKPGHILSGNLTDKSPRSVLNRAISQGMKVHTRIVNYNKAGQPYWAEIHLEPIHDSKGQISGYISIEKDVTKEEKHQHDIGELSASMYEQLVEALNHSGNGATGNMSIMDTAKDVGRVSESPEEFIRRWRSQTSIASPDVRPRGIFDSTKAD
ncbi:MAG: PAS domain-containing protein [Verrucomicrobia bacterium]|nr:PAS domain-containing protein [Verrucomicrobiota bacterium]